MVGDITAYIKKNYPEARVEPAKVENLFEQLFKGEDALIIYLSGESARKIEDLSKINAFIDHLNEEMPGLKLNKPAVQERIVVQILPERLSLYKVNQNVLLNTLEKNISKVSIGKLNTGNLYIPIVITENEHTIGIFSTRCMSNSIEVYSVAVRLDLSMEYDYKRKFSGKRRESSCLFRHTIRWTVSGRL